MKTNRHLGIWMDYSSAYVIELNNNAIISKTIESEFTKEKRQKILNRSENVMHNAEREHFAKYYGKIMDEIADFSEVILFGPTKAKQELANLINQNPHFKGIRIETTDADKMTVNQQHAFVRKHYKESKG